jgi:hypothetical protein
VPVQQIHYSLPTLDKPPKPMSRQKLAEATRKYDELLKKAKERWEEQPA